MEPVDVPRAPPGMQSEVARHFRAHGWAWGEDVMVSVIGQLAVEGIEDARALGDVYLCDVPGALLWPPEVAAFVENLTRVHCICLWFICVVFSVCS